MAKFAIDDKVNIVGRVTEIVENESQGVRYKVKVKANDTLQYLNFEEDELVEVAAEEEP